MKRILEIITAILLSILSCIVFINIVLRYGFQTSILSVDELSRFLFVWLIFIGAILAYMENSHVQVTFLVEKLSTKNRTRVGIITHLIVIGLCGMLFVGGIGKVVQDWNDHTPILGLPVGLLYAASLPMSLTIGILEIIKLFSTFTAQSKKNNHPLSQDD